MAMNQFFNDTLTRLQNATAPELTVLVLTGVLVIFFVLLLCACRTNRRLDEECDALDDENDELKDEVEHIQRMGEELFLEYTKLTLAGLKLERRHRQVIQKLKELGIEIVFMEDLMTDLDRLFKPQCGNPGRGESADVVTADEITEDDVIDGDCCAGNGCCQGSGSDSGG
jgi:hypothetical protein